MLSRDVFERTLEQFNLKLLLEGIANHSVRGIETDSDYFTMLPFEISVCGHIKVNLPSLSDAAKIIP